MMCVLVCDFSDEYNIIIRTGMASEPFHRDRRQLGKVETVRMAPETVSEKADDDNNYSIILLLYKRRFR